MRKKLLLASFFALCVTLSYSQKGLSLHGGIGIAELAHIGVRYYGKPVTVGATLGALRAGGENILSGSASAYLHFGGQPKFADRRPWFTRLSLTLTRSDSEYVTEYHTMAGLRIGREAKLSDRFGLNFDLGIEYPIEYSVVFKKPMPYSYFGFSMPIPGFSITGFYQF